MMQGICVIHNVSSIIFTEVPVQNNPHNKTLFILFSLLQKQLNKLELIHGRIVHNQLHDDSILPDISLASFLWGIGKQYNPR